MLKAIIFDCDGVIADTEPLHLATFQTVLAQEGITLTAKEYYTDYLALDDRGCFTLAYARQGRTLSDGKLAHLIRQKADYLEPVMRERLHLFPGVKEFIREAASRYPLAVASGALRAEVELILKHAEVRHCFEAVVAAEDVARGKPHPDPFLKARALLSERRAPSIEPAYCLVVEDSIHGVRAAHEAGMRCLAVSNSYTREQLSEAEVVVASLAEVTLAEVEALF
jgi:HAD superfamily hydrolase (TIGR01509 family)